MNKFAVVWLLIICGAATAFAQDKDFGVWTSVEAEKKILPGLTASVEGEFRTRNDLGTVDRYSGSIGLSYRIWSFLKFGGEYSYIRFNHDKRGWENGHRYNLFVTGSYKWQRFNISLRERYQHTYRKGVSSTQKRANPKDMLRSRAQVAYDIRKSPFTPYVSMELYHTLNDPQDNGLEKIRYTFGTHYKLNKRHSFQLFYRFQDDRSGDPDLHVFGAGYSVKL